jgi:hypothetical protein
MGVRGWVLSSALLPYERMTFLPSRGSSIQSTILEAKTTNCTLLNLWGLDLGLPSLQNYKKCIT